MATVNEVIQKATTVKIGELEAEIVRLNEALTLAKDNEQEAYKAEQSALDHSDYLRNELEGSEKWHQNHSNRLIEQNQALKTVLKLVL